MLYAVHRQIEEGDMDKLAADLLSKCTTNAIRQAVLNCLTSGMTVADVVALIDFLNNN
jgi:hypothetical protein